MIRYPSSLIFFVILFAGVSLYQIKHFITKKEIELAQIKNNIKSAQSNINILKAELGVDGVNITSILLKTLL